MPSQSALTATALTANTFTRDNFSFEGWKGAGSTLAYLAKYPFDEPATVQLLTSTIFDDDQVPLCADEVPDGP